MDIKNFRGNAIKKVHYFKIEKVDGIKTAQSKK